MRILLLDDDETLRKILADTLRMEVEFARLGDAVVYDTGDPEEAKRYLREEGPFELAVCDVYFAKDGRPRTNKSKQKMRGFEVLDEAKRRGSFCIAISTGVRRDPLRAEVEARRRDVDLYLSKDLIDEVSVLTHGFVQRMLEAYRERSISEETSAVVPATQNTAKPEYVLVYVALDEEREVVASQMGLKSEASGAYWQGDIGGVRYPIHLVVGGLAGRVRAAVFIGEHLCREGSPKHIFSLGICGGFKQQGVHEGDVVIPDHIADYASRKVCEEKQEFRPDNPACAESFLEAINSDAFGETAWQVSTREHASYPKDAIPTLRKRGSLVCADEVVASEEYGALLMRLFNKPWGVDMESGAVGFVARRHGIPFNAVRGVSDFADPWKIDNEWRARALRAAVACLIQGLGVCYPVSPTGV